MIDTIKPVKRQNKILKKKSIEKIHGEGNCELLIKSNLARKKNSNLFTCDFSPKFLSSRFYMVFCEQEDG